MKSMEQSSTNDELLVNLLINKAKVSSNTTPVSKQNALNIEKVDDTNQFLTLTKKLEKVEQDILSLYNLVHKINTTCQQCNKDTAKCKKE